MQPRRSGPDEEDDVDDGMGDDVLQMFGVHARVSDLAGKKFKWIDSNNEYTWAIDTEKTTDEYLHATVRRRSDMQRSIGCDGCAVAHYTGENGRRSKRSAHCSATTGENRFEEYQMNLSPGEFVLLPLKSNQAPFAGVWKISEFINATHKYKTCDVICENVS